MIKGSTTIINVCNAVLKYGIYILIALVPILYLPWTADALDFNKQAVLVLLSFFALFAWMIRVLVMGKLSINTNKTYIAVAGFFAVSLLATVFSSYKYGSFWGWPGATSESLLTLIGLVLVYFLVSNVFSKKQILISIAILSLSCIAAIAFGALQLFGLFIPFFSAKSTSFNTIGMVGSFGVFIAVLLPLLIILEIYSKKWLKIAVGAGLILSAVSLVLINYSVVWWLVLAGCALIILFGMFKKNFFDLRWLGLPIFFLVIALFFLILKPQIPVPARAVEVFLNQSASFDIALNTLKEKPILGSGPGTFVYDFSKFKKVEFNQSVLWNVRFDRAGSKALTLLATTGILGLIAFLVLIGIVLFYAVKFLLDKGLEHTEGEGGYKYMVTTGILIAFLVQVAGYFLYSSNFTLEFVYFLLIAGFIGLITEERKEYPLNPSSLLTLSVTFASTLIFIFGLGLIILDGQRYIAEVKYINGVSAISSGQLDKGLNSLESAVKLNPKADIYLTQLSQAYLSKLGEVINDENLSDENRSQGAQILINNAINAAKMATDVNPKNVSDWSVRGYVYQNLIGVVPGAEDWAINMYEEAVNLEPVNPYYPTQKGIVYIAQASIVNKDDSAKKNLDLNNAKTELDKAIELKSDYAPARFQIAMVYQAQGKIDQEVQALEDVKKSSPNDIGLLFQIGLVYYQEGNFNKARTNLESAVSISPNYANALYFLGLSYAKLGQADKAVTQFNKILSLNPDNQEVKTILANLNSGKDPLSGISQENPPQTPVQEAPPEVPEK
ncbi:MAG: tetratricopeptide repeat protein [Candidatus Staskawiczbacteria bacterium]|nr:tetratricopeptide repeat protein [Candidatus Staskawiczbacteria bacterium]